MVDDIRSRPQLQEKTVKLRRILAEQGEVAYDKAKERLPAVLFGGKFSYANDKGLDAHSGLMVIDFDDLPQAEVHLLKARLASDPHTLFAYISPSGCGIKWVVAVAATDALNHSACWEGAAAYCREKFGLDADPSGADLSRKSFLCHDADVVLGQPTGHFTPLFDEPGLIIGEVGGIGAIGGVRGFSSLSPLSLNPPSSSPITSVLPSLASLVDVNQFLPEKGHDNHHNYLWNLARSIMGAEAKSKVKFSPVVVDELVAQWYQLARPEFRPHSLEHYQDEVADMLIRVRCPQGEGGKQWKEACTMAQTDPPAFTTELSYRDGPVCSPLLLAVARPGWKIFPCPDGGRKIPRLLPTQCERSACPAEAHGLDRTHFFGKTRSGYRGTQGKLVSVEEVVSISSGALGRFTASGGAERMPRCADRRANSAPPSPLPGGQCRVSAKWLQGIPGTALGRLPNPDRQIVWRPSQRVPRPSRAHG
ncbi:MAG TPA: BT4734/BF3469 family protein [Methylomirabilota bacterium]|nr:BT4734/BF3469 family protein [Methylomirabilota bacterium]